MTSPRRGRRSILPPPETLPQIGDYFADRLRSIFRPQRSALQLEEPLRVNGIALADSVHAARQMAPTFSGHVAIGALTHPQGCFEVGEVVSVEGYALSMGEDGVFLDWRSTLTLGAELCRALGPARRVSFWSWEWLVEYRGLRSTLLVTCDRPLVGKPRVVHRIPELLRGCENWELSSDRQDQGLQRGWTVNGIVPGMARASIENLPIGGGVSVEFQEDPLRRCSVVSAVQGTELFMGPKLLVRAGDPWLQVVSHMGAHGIYLDLSLPAHTSLPGRERRGHCTALLLLLPAPVEGQPHGLMELVTDSSRDHISYIRAHALAPPVHTTEFE